ncbi:hypothetical protein [Alteromonas lipolytica]|uniref:Uncharacterized protein n=1 Tax=Alteromonas lipolytica TaxID=1856405 RepID=A0A1E8FEA0_9ALTE|nr:hypothetical protein [Alteromonas lipolytica]OFI33918.1 hypothetical protein BFC17_20350 [Alteromonas lipolytica]GGF67290.1 hypothetical protein GCM10011338_19290 [Alteromonas lipolytica]
MSNQSQFIRIYKRASQSPWDDHSTVLLLANASQQSDEIELDFSRYIYLHRDVAGRVLGLSLSKSIIAESELDCERYVSGEMMYVILLMYVDEISSFCELFAEEFETLFLAGPAYYLTTLIDHWAEKLD